MGILIFLGGMVAGAVLGVFLVALIIGSGRDDKY